jgi:enhancer of mRNA-decapping protein 3
MRQILKEEDHIPSEERLVSHNRVARPGTFGGKNLHPTENVLDPQPRSGTAQKSISRRGSARQPSISSESSAESNNHVRISSRISSARVAQKRFPVRTNTSGTNVQKLSRTATGASGRLETSTHSIRHLASSTSNENISRLTPAASPLIQTTTPTAGKVHLYIDNDSNSICPTITPGIIVAVENLASSDHDIPLALINENAGRSLAEIIISELISRSQKEAKRSFSALFLVGNHRAGARALVAARHLRDRGVSSICCVLGLDRPGHSLNAEVDEQLSRIRIPETASANSSSNRSALVVVASWREVVKFLSHQTDEQDIWVDALLAPTYTYDTLVPDEQNAVVEMVEWANEGKLILSIDTPCGINASTGM